MDADAFPRLDERELAFLRSSAKTVVTWGEVTASWARELAPQAKITPAVPGEEPADAALSLHDLEASTEPLSRLQAYLATCTTLLTIVVAYNEYPLAHGHRAQFRTESFPERLGEFFRIEARILGGKEDAPELLVVYGSATYLEERYAATDGHEAERAKWDALYAGAPPVEAHATPGFHDELARCVAQILEPGDSVLEAGCGQGNGSLALARLDRFSVNLLDFSENALRYARALFAREGFEATSYIHDDVFAPNTTDRFDLVFNAGSLEHYTFDEQISFLRGMARMSRRYVLVLWPNRECYWYWIWRVRAASQHTWPFGKEVPSTDMDAALRAAGLTPLGHRPFGVESTANILTRLTGLEESLRADLLRVHNSPLLPLSQRAYLVAALAAVDANTRVPGDEWSEPRHDEMPMAELTAALADAMATNIAAQRTNLALSKAHATASEAARKARAESERERAQLARAERRLRSIENSRTWRVRSRVARMLPKARTR